MQRALQVPGFEHESVVEGSLSLQSEAESQRTEHAVLEQDDEVVPGLMHASVVDELLSLQSLSELHTSAWLPFESLPDMAWVHKEDVVPGLTHASVVDELLSLQSAFELHSIEEEGARFRHELLQPPALLQLSVVVGLLSLQSLSEVHAIVQLPVVLTISNAAFPELPTE